MAKLEAKVVPELLCEFTDQGFGSTAVWAFEVAVLDEGDPSVGWPADVIDVGVDRLEEVQQIGLKTGSPGKRQPRWQAVDRAKDDPGEARRNERRGEDPELGLLEFLAAEGDVGNEQRHGEADAAKGRRTYQRWPRHGQGQAIQAAAG